MSDPENTSQETIEKNSGSSGPSYVEIVPSFSLMYVFYSKSLIFISLYKSLHYLFAVAATRDIQ